MILTLVSIKGERGPMYSMRESDSKPTIKTPLFVYLLLLLLLISFLLRYHRWLKLTFREKAKD